MSAADLGAVSATDHSTTAAAPTSWYSSVGTFLTNPLGSLFTGTSFLPNAALVVVGVVLALGALLVSQKETIVKVGELAA